MAGLWLLMVSVPAVYAFNQEIPAGGDVNAIGNCTGSGNSPCIRWDKTPGNLSINVDVYLNNNLSSEEEDLKAVALGAMAQYNAVAARNPHLQQTTSTQNEEMYVQAFNLTNPRAYGSTNYTLNGANRIVYASIRFNTQIEWNLTYDYACRSIPVNPNEVCKADAHKVVRHEFGHAEGLAHVALSVQAVMVQGEPASRYHSLQSDDRNGIIHIYGAYP
jgi:hypothetical protein